MNPSDPSENSDFMPPVLTVSALNQAVSRMLERTFPLLWVAGEISNFTRAASGHWYFTLKDDAAQVRAVMFKSRAQYAGFHPREGDRVEVRALVTLYSARGDYQINVEAIRRAGVGALYDAFLKLKEKLSDEGLFDSARKRPLPRFVKTAGIVTSPQAAALRDVLTTLKRRAPYVRLILYPCPVQGSGAAEKISAAISAASVRAECDVLLVCRGGGSIEDLWSFNDEGVARTIAACSMPVISGIGHETDFTIADFVADLRAPTPTAAAEIAATPHVDWVATLTAYADDMTRTLQRHLADKAQALDWYSRRLASPEATIRHERLRMLALKSRMDHASRTPIATAHHALKHLRTRLSAQLPDTQAQRMQLADQARRMASRMKATVMHRRQALDSLKSQLYMLDPQRTLDRGYAIVIDAQSKIVRNPANIHPDEMITLRLAQGSTQGYWHEKSAPDDNAATPSLSTESPER